MHTVLVDAALSVQSVKAVAAGKNCHRTLVQVGCEGAVAEMA